MYLQYDQPMWLEAKQQTVQALIRYLPDLDLQYLSTMEDIIHA